jgi:hypothetical protein
VGWAHVSGCQTAPPCCGRRGVVCPASFFFFFSEGTVTGQRAEGATSATEPTTRGAKSPRTTQGTSGRPCTGETLRTRQRAKGNPPLPSPPTPGTGQQGLHPLLSPGRRPQRPGIHPRRPHPRTRLVPWRDRPKPTQPQFAAARRQQKLRGQPKAEATKHKRRHPGTGGA